MHRSPGDASTLTAIETAFQPLAQSWVAAEAEAGGAGSFTRVMVGQVKQNILGQIADEAGMQQLCRDLSHLYHYYLHGPQGSRGGGRAAGSPGRDGPLPEITIQCISGSRTVWSVNLADITDDMESQYLQVVYHSEYRRAWLPLLNLSTTLLLHILSFFGQLVPLGRLDCQSSALFN